jgi:hypothetical protein
MSFKMFPKLQMSEKNEWILIETKANTRYDIFFRALDKKIQQKSKYTQETTTTSLNKNYTKNSKYQHKCKELTITRYIFICF